MSEKTELAGYMASLLTLLEHQDKSGVHGRSQELGAEFDRCWESLKGLIRKEQEDASRKSNQYHPRPKDSAANERGESGGSGTDRRSSYEPEGGPTFERSGPSSPADVVNNPSRR